MWVSLFLVQISMYPQGRVPEWVNGKTEVIINGVDSQYEAMFLFGSLVVAIIALVIDITKKK